MRKLFLSMAVLAIVLGTSSCNSSSSSSFESDVRKMASYSCKMQKLMAKDPSDEKAKKELEELEKEMKDYGEKMEEKYKDKKDDKKMEEEANKIMKEEMAKCK